MKFIVFDKVSVPQKRGGIGDLPKITFTKSGAISLNKYATELLGFKEGYKFSLCQDEENPTEWYVFSHDNGFVLRKKNANGSLTIQHTILVHEFFNAFGFPLATTRSFIIAGKPTVVDNVKYFGILINSIL